MAALMRSLNEFDDEHDKQILKQRVSGVPEYPIFLSKASDFSWILRVDTP
jgi:hypothetical protein